MSALRCITQREVKRKEEATTDRFIPTGGERLVVVLEGVHVEQLARVIGIVPGFLKPDGEVLVVETLRDEDFIATL